MSKSFALLGSVSLLTLVSSLDFVAADDLPQLTVVIRAESTQPAGLPILLTLSITNDSDKPYFYRGGARIPEAHFSR